MLGNVNIPETENKGRTRSTANSSSLRVVQVVVSPSPSPPQATLLPQNGEVVHGPLLLMELAKVQTHFFKFRQRRKTMREKNNTTGRPSKQTSTIDNSPLPHPSRPRTPHDHFSKQLQPLRSQVSSIIEPIAFFRPRPLNVFRYF